MVKKNGLRWGFGGPPYWEFQNFDADPILSRLKFVAKMGMTGVGVGLGEIVNATDAQRAAYEKYMREHDIVMSPGVGFDYLNATDDTIRKSSEEIIGGLRKHRRFWEGAIVKTGPHAGHRFDRVMSVEQKMAKLSRAMKPVVAACAEMGLPFGIENHGDYYCSDLVELVKMTPGLGLFLDTGNTYLIAERPIPAFEAAAPYVVGTHWKDHRVGPNPQTLMFEIKGAVLGEGDVCLRECWGILMTRNPNPKKIFMELEMIAPKGMNPLEAMAKSLEFCWGLPE